MKRYTMRLNETKLDLLKLFTGLTNATEIVRKALDLYIWYMATVKAGRKLIIREQDGSEETIHIL